MVRWQKYHRAQSIKDALQVLASSPGPAVPLAGGTDLLLDLQQGRHGPVHTLVDVSAIAELTALEARRDVLFIGAAVPLSEIEASGLVQNHAPALVEASALIGGPQVRNTATLGGNVAHALPAADGTIALIALDAQAEVADLEGRRLVPLIELFRGPGQSALDPQRELLVGFQTPLARSGEGSAFRRVMRPQGVAIAILNMAAWIRRDGSRIADVRLSVGPSGPTPRRMQTVEAALRGEALSEKLMVRAQELLLAEAHFRTSRHRASTEYRRLLVNSLLEETLTAAYTRAAPSAEGVS